MVASTSPGKLIASSEVFIIIIFSGAISTVKFQLYPVSQPLDWPQTFVFYGESYVSIAVRWFNPNINCNCVASSLALTI